MLNNSMNQNTNNVKGGDSMENTTITYKSVSNNRRSYRGLKAHDKFRQLQIKDLHAHKFVINRVDFIKDKETKEIKQVPYLAIVDDSPLIREFENIEEAIKVVKSNVLAYECKDDKTNKKEQKKARRINIDGDKYIFCSNIMAVRCGDDKLINKLANEGFMFNNELYFPVNASPSNEKHEVKYFFRFDNELNHEAAFWKVDDIMGGSLSDKLMGEEEDEQGNMRIKFVDGKTITKANTRIGNYASGMKCLFEIPLDKYRVALVKGSMNQAGDFDVMTEKEMRDKGIEIEHNINDGASYFSTTVILGMADKLGMRMSEEDALQIAPQVRTTMFTGKTLARAFRTEDLKELADNYNAEFFGNPEGELVALFDEDGAKMVNMTDLKAGKGTIKVYVMAVANMSGVSTCGQHLIKYLDVDAEQTTKIVRNYAMEALDNFVVGKVEEGNENDSLSNNRIIAKLGKAESLKDSFLMEAIMSDTWKYAQSMLAQCKVRIPGVYTHMMFDLTYALTKGLVKSILGITEYGIIEMYNPDVLELYADEIAEIENDDTLTEEEKDQALFYLLSGTIVKFPSAMPKEFELGVYQTKRQIRNKIEASVSELDITNEEKETMINKLVNYFEYTPWGCTVYAPVNAMKNKLAGADCDFDATMCDMSDLKFILIKQRLENKGFMGECTFISYKDIVRNKVEKPAAITVAEEVQDLDI